MRFALLLASVITAACSSADPVPEGGVRDTGADTLDDTAIEDTGAIDTGPPPAATVTVNDFAYKPATVTVNVGDTVLWRFTFGTHSVTSGTSCTSVSMPELNSGEHGSPFNYWHTFMQAGTYDYFCTYMQHCTMGQVGKVIVQ